MNLYVLAEEGEQGLGLVVRKATDAEVLAVALANGERVEWCEVHKSSWNYALSMLCDQKLRSLHLDPAPAELDGDCVEVVKFLSDYPKEADDE